MTGLPELKDEVTIWPAPGRKVQDGPRPVDFMGGGRWLPEEGKKVVWTEFHLEQLRAGDILLHSPTPEAAEAPAEEETEPFRKNFFSKDKE